MACSQHERSIRRDPLTARARPTARARFAARVARRRAAARPLRLPSERSVPPELRSERRRRRYGR
ncbi:hypothetical protein ACFPRL_12080 [Pseudoclavibacter helvolus]